MIYLVCAMPPRPPPFLYMLHVFEYVQSWRLCFDFMIANVSIFFFFFNHLTIDTCATSTYMKI